MTSSTGGLAYALSQNDSAAIYGDSVYYDPNGGCSTASAGSGTALSSGGSSTSGGAFSTNQLKSFAHEPINSTWSISDSTAEQWFLKQAGAQPIVAKYGLTPSNIGSITSAIKAANVSPVFFYAYVVNEGGGSGGFINHYSGDAPGGGVGNATTDAQYLATQSKTMDSQPSWIDAGNPVDFVPKDVKDAGNADFQSMPSGTIGRAYIPATAAAAWGVYYPNGLKKEYNQVQDYANALSQTMQSIQKMGGDPMQGGASVSSDGCSSGITGSGIAKAVSWTKAIANNDGYGYDQATRATGWITYQTDPGCTNQCGSFDCSSLISAALTEAGYFQTNPNFATGSEESSLQQAGFTKVSGSYATSANLKPGDILVNRADHTAMYIGNDQVVQASSNENGGATGGVVGDQNGKEISVGPYYNFPWDSVWRAPN